MGSGYRLRWNARAAAGDSLPHLGLASRSAASGSGDCGTRDAMRVNPGTGAEHGPGNGQGVGGNGWP